MRNQHHMGLVLMIRGLLAVWLFLGCVVLTDQLQLTQETSSQDEEALLQLASCLKPDVPQLEGALSNSGITDASVSSSFITTEEDANQETRSIIQVVPTLRLHQPVAVYRI